MNGQTSDATSAVLDRLHAVIEARRGADPGTSYTAQLFSAGTAGIARKLGEEAVETVLAGAAGDREQTVRESADLLYHLMVLWAETGVAPDDVWAELARREGISGIEVKNNRGKQSRG